MRGHKKLWISVGVVLAVGIALFGYPNSIGRQVRYLWANKECFKRPASGGVAAIGDSITAGIGRPDWGFLGQYSWLDTAACHDGLPYSYNGGVPNQTTQQIADRVPGVLSHHPKVLVILAGVNDIYQGRSGPAALGRIQTMIDETKAAHVQPVLGTVTPVLDHYPQTVVLDDQLRQLARADGIPLIDFYKAVADPQGRWPKNLTRDGLHPNEAGATAMADAALPVLRPLVVRARG